MHLDFHANYRFGNQSHSQNNHNRQFRISAFYAYSLDLSQHYKVINGSWFQLSLWPHVLGKNTQMVIKLLVLRNRKWFSIEICPRNMSKYSMSVCICGFFFSWQRHVFLSSLQSLFGQYGEAYSNRMTKRLIGEHKLHFFWEERFKQITLKPRAKEKETKRRPENNSNPRGLKGIYN